MALQLELAQRYWHRAEYDQCRVFYNRAADTTSQPPLRERALYSAQQCEDRSSEGGPREVEVDASGEPIAQP